MITYQADMAAIVDVADPLVGRLSRRKIPDPGERLATIHRLREHLDQLELVAVQEMRSSGTPWSEIAGPLEVSREAVWQRYHHQAPGPTDKRLT